MELPESREDEVEEEVVEIVEVPEVQSEEGHDDAAESDFPPRSADLIHATVDDFFPPRSADLIRLIAGKAQSGPTEYWQLIKLSVS